MRIPAAKANMKVLQISPKSPFLKTDGGALAIHAITEGLLHQNIQLDVLHLETQKHSFAKVSTPHFKNLSIDSIFLQTRINVFTALFCLFKGKSYNILRFYSKAFEAKIIRAVQNNDYDIIHLEGLYVSQYISKIKKHSNAKIILRSHNLEFLIWERMAKQCKNFIKKLLLHILAFQLRKYETSILQMLDGLVCISSAEIKKYDKLHSTLPKTVIPFGINLREYPYQPNFKKDSFFHLGSLDWLPNKEGITWFLEHIWKPYHRKHPTSTFYLAGRNLRSHPELCHITGVEVIEDVPQASSFMQKHGVMIVPLLSGGGIRIKILEGMALGTPIVTTELGAEGLGTSSGTHLLQAKTTQDFIQHMELVHSEKTATKISDAAREFIEQNYDQGKLSLELVRFYHALAYPKQLLLSVFHFAQYLY